MFVAAYYGLLRVSKMTGKHAAKAGDVHIARNKKKVQIRLWTHKTLKWGNWPDDIKIDGLMDCHRCHGKVNPNKSSSQYCPVHILMEYNSWDS